MELIKPSQEAFRGARISTLRHVETLLDFICCVLFRLSGKIRFRSSLWNTAGPTMARKVLKNTKKKKKRNYWVPLRKVLGNRLASLRPPEPPKTLQRQDIRSSRTSDHSKNTSHLEESSNRNNHPFVKTIHSQ